MDEDEFEDKGLLCIAPSCSMVEKGCRSVECVVVVVVVVEVWWKRTIVVGFTGCYTADGRDSSPKKVKRSRFSF
jgi:hypothetical protein